MSTIIIHTQTLKFEQIKRFERSYGKPYQQAQHYQIDTDKPINPVDLADLANEFKFDINLLPSGFKPSEVKLVISDMDSTLIAIECIDEIADMMNLKPQVSEITEAAMRGELNFEESLTQRVALLEGLDTQALQTVYDERLTLNPGAEKCLAGLKQKNIKFALVSGGFDFFTNRLQQSLNLDFARANKLKTTQHKLTGQIDGSIIGAQAKADFLHELCEQLNINSNQVIAVGDGANDLLMMAQAGLSIAYHAKPKVQQQASCSFNYRGLDAILDFVS
ncbi:MAG: phosphoserine phosphatase SerB [Thiomicrospira sp.]|uniref:phosphoserine phosphatase SerB n=1 Tax=Thiomicrospira sp. TaxID=935 RepID=UPI0019DE411F|nr:phosphoserine phosphatase SerB [Thiomicrospira sp.]MBE0494252.1 phosphoserine phosphatase SerB [Thiomicrospira sp.]